MAFDPMSTIIQGGAAVIGAVVSAIGAAVAQGDYDKARALREEALSEYGDAISPKLDKAVAEQVGPTAFAAITPDAAPRKTQTDAMRRLADIYENGGMTSQDEAAMQIANQGAQQQAQSSYQAVQQQLAQRGQSNNPALMAALASKVGQTTALASSTNRYQAQADARNRAMQALGMSADVAGSVRGADYGEASDKASAVDRFNMFNAGQRTNASNENARRTQANYDNDMRLRDSRYGAKNNMAGSYERSGDATRQTTAGIGNAIGTLGAGAAKSYDDQQDYSRRKPQ